jgi:O-antigen/teichoic acid export membrane protein
MRSNPYKQENLRQGAFHYLLGRGAAGVAGFLTVLLLVRFMDLSNYAAYTALSGVVVLCGVIASLGIERVISRYLPEARLYRSVEELSRFIWRVSVVRWLTISFVVLLLYAFWPLIGRFLAVAEFKQFPVALACFIVAETMFQHFSAILQSLVMQKTLTRLLVIQWGGRLLLIGFFIFFKANISWQDAMWISAIPEVLGVIGFVIVIYCHLQRLGSERTVLNEAKWPQWSKVVEVGMHNYGFSLLAAPPQGYFMKILAAAYLPLEVVAAYGFFLSLAEKVRQYIPLHFFYGMLEPIMVAAYLKDRNFSELSYRCQLLYKSNLLLMVPVIVWIAIAGDSIVSVLTGGKFQGLSWILLMVMVQLTIGSHVILLQLILNSLEKSKILFMASCVALPVLFFAMALAIFTNPIFLLGTPILFSLTLNFYIINRLAHASHAYKPSWRMLGGVFFCGLIALCAGEILKWSMSLNAVSLINAISGFCFVIAVYLAAIWIFKAIERSEIELIKTIIFNVQQKRAGA